MASTKEPQPSRPLSQQRLSVSSTPSSSLPIRHSASRHHSHSVSLGTLNPAHRVTRRKSMTTSAANMAAVAAVISGADDASFGASNRRSLNSRTSASIRGVESTSLGNASGLASNDYAGNTVPKHDGLSGQEIDAADNGTAVTDGPNLAESNEYGPRARGRRASEGSHLAKNDPKRASGSDLKCEKCGKGYKHSSCLTKHLWEHTPEWSYTSKLLISKHQQVQLLEAASVLVTMNQDGSMPPDPAKNSDSDHSSASPAASGASDPNDEDISSAESTPPPMNEQAYTTDSSGVARPKRYSTNSSAFSRSYQSAPSSSFMAGSVPSGTSYGQHYTPSYQRRPSTSDAGYMGHANADEDEAGLAAAVESLCSFGTPRTGPVHLPADVPPVPPLPARFAVQNSLRLSGAPSTPMLQQGLGVPPPLTHQLSDERDVRMGESHVADVDDDYDHRSYSRGRSEDDDDGVFGSMEE